MSIFLIAIFGGCDLNEVDFDNLKTPKITNLIAIPIGEIEYGVRELIDELNLDSTVIQEDSATTLLSLVYTDTFSYTSQDDLINIDDITNSAAIGLQETPVSPVTVPVPINETFNFSYSGTEQEQIDSVTYNSGQLTLTVTSNIDPTISFDLTISNTTDPNGSAVVFTGAVSNSTFTDSRDLTGYTTSLSIQGQQSTFQVIFNGNADVLAGQSIAPTDSIRFSLTYQNQTFSILYGNFGVDTVDIAQQTIDIDFFEELTGSDAIEFKDPQLNINLRNNIGIPLGIIFNEAFSVRDDQGNFSDTTFIEGPGVSNPQVFGSPTTAEVGQTIESTISLNRNNSNLNVLFANAPNQLVFNASAISNPSGTDQQNFYRPGQSMIEGDIEFRIPLEVKLTDLQTERDFPLGNPNFDVADSVSLRIVTLNLLPFSADLRIQFVDENDMVIYELPEKLVLQTAFLNADLLATEKRPFAANIPLNAEGIEALNTGDRINLVVTLNTPKTLNSQEIFPAILARYSLTVKISAVGKMNVEFQELSG